jgi:hypothetical protein
MGALLFAWNGIMDVSLKWINSMANKILSGFEDMSPKLLKKSLKITYYEFLINFL